MTIDGANLIAPGKPTWRGYGANLEQRYLAFVQKQQKVIAQAQPERLARVLQEAEYALGNARAGLKQLNVKRDAQNEAIGRIVQIIDRDLTDELIADELACMAEMDCVIGTRTDMQGRLVVQIRVTAVKDGKILDGGDYEIVLAHSDRYSNESYLVHLIRVPRGIEVYSIRAWRIHNSEGAAWTGSMTVPGYHVWAAHLVDFVANIHEQLVQATTQVGYRMHGFPEFENPEQVWDGYTQNPVKAYRKSVALMQSDSPKQILRNLERDLNYINSEITQALERVRTKQTTLRNARAAHAKAVAAAETDVVLDVQQIKKDIGYIAQLPGVMGIRFDGEGTPIIHVRTTYARNGRRFDLGDIEVHLTKRGRNETVSVVKIRATRIPRRSMYLHSWGTEHEWFCFGARARELEELFDRGDYPQFVHIAINTLNAINNGDNDLYYMLESYNEIPMGATWMYQPKPTRQRRRPRKGLENVLSEN